MIDALAVGEPLEMTTMRRIADPDADRGSPSARPDNRRRSRRRHGGATGASALRRGATVAITRNQVAPTARTGRRRTGDGRGSDDMRKVVRRASLSLDSDLTPDTDLLLKAARGAVWVGDLRLADRLAKAAIRAGGSPRANFLRAHALSWLPPARRPTPCWPSCPIQSSPTTTAVGSLTYAPSTCCGLSVTPARAKEIIDDAARGTPRLASGSTPSSPCTGLRWTSRKRRYRRRKALCWKSCRPSRAPRPRGRLP